MMNRNTAATGCLCAAYPSMTSKGSPHRMGSLRCLYRTNGEQRHYGDPDYVASPEEDEYMRGSAEVYLSFKDGE